MPLRILHYSDIENATDDPHRIGRLTHCLREGCDDRTLICGTGDTTAPGLLSMETDGEHIDPFYETVAPDFSTVGNHDFDNGVDALRSIIERSPQTWLVANIREDDGPFAHDLGVRPTAVSRVGDDADTQVGFVGVTDPKTLGNHIHAERLTITDPVEAVEDAVTGLPEVDHVVVLSHAGPRDDDIARIGGVDIVLGGHDHDRRNDTVDGTRVVHPGECAELVSEVELTGEGVTVSLHDVAEFPVATEMVDSYRELYTDLGLDETVARVEAPVSRGRDARYPETRIGNFVVDAFRWTAGTDVALVHPFMFRSGPPLEGEVSVRDVRATVPFDNELHSTMLDGDELLSLFESLDPPEFLDETEVFGHVSGATLSWVQNSDSLELVDVAVSGDRPDPSETYTVAAPAFEFSSDLYPALDEDRIEASHGHQHDAVVEYAREHGIDHETDGRIQLVSDAASGEFQPLR